MTGPLATMLAAGKGGLARALSALETEPAAPRVTALLDAAFAHPRGHALGLTGPPGVGKSTLIDGLVRHWRGAGRSVGIVAVDPSSPGSGGSLLGDRARLALDPEDHGIFVRSMAARDRLGGVAEITFPAIVLMRATFDRVIVETVGVGQSETEVARLTDTVVLCAQPGSGDGLQFLKAGIMETPDIAVVTKADLGQLAARTVADLKSALAITAGQTHGTTPPVLACSARSGEGLAALADAIDLRAEAEAPKSDRDAQLSAWRTAHLSHHFGRAGLAALEGRLRPTGTSSPFAEAAETTQRLETALVSAIASFDR